MPKNSAFPESQPETSGTAAKKPQPETSEPAAKRKGKRLPIIVAVCAVIAAAGAGLWVWHEQPAFCSAICHNPMDPYLATYEAESGQTAVDKWGNEVADDAYLLAVTHRTDAQATCMSCHIPTLGEQVGEAASWVTGNFYSPLDERSLADLTEARGVDDDTFCLNESCHNLSRADLVGLTANKYSFNPHTPQHGAQDCTSCHKTHRQSVMLCTECHTEAVVPEGWLSADEGKRLAQA